MEPSKEAIAVRISRLNRMILGKVTSNNNKLINKNNINRETLLDALTVLYDECNEDPLKKADDLVRVFVDKFRSTVADLRRTRVIFSDFEILQSIGCGYFGDVHMVREKQTGDVYALKSMRKEDARRRISGFAEDERDVLANANSPWFPKLQYAFQDNNNLYLVMELCSGGDLAGLLKRDGAMCERDAAFYVAEVAHGLHALHQMGFVHRDLKPQNILLDRCGHVKLGDLGCAERVCAGVGGGAGCTAEYGAPELLAAAHCAATHRACSDCCRGLVASAVTACDYWSLGVVAFELVTLKRPFSSDNEESVPETLANIQRYEREGEARDASALFAARAAPASDAWRALVGGLLRVTPARRFTYLDTLRHAALQHLSLHSIRDQAPPWVPCVRGPEDASYFEPAPRVPPPPSAAPFRSRPPFAGQLPFIGYTYIATEDAEENSSGFNASHDCTAIDMATYKSSEKLAALRGREVASLQRKLADAEANAEAMAERARHQLESRVDADRAHFSDEIAKMSLKIKQLERQLETEREERSSLQRQNAELKNKMAAANESMSEAGGRATTLEGERAALRSELARLEGECERLRADADAARTQQQHYKDIIEQVHKLKHRRLTEINVRPIDTIAKERALRRQTLSGLGEGEGAAEARAAREARARAAAEAEASELKARLEDANKQLAAAQECEAHSKRTAEASTAQLHDVQQQLTQERVKTAALSSQIEELKRSVGEAAKREAALEEQGARTEARLKERLEDAEARATAAAHDDARHREKVCSLEQLVRQLEREVSALEREAGSRSGAPSDTESVGDPVLATPPSLKEALERAEAQLMTRAEEMAVLRQEARAANLARWRKEREHNELSLEVKSKTREVKRLEERLAAATEARKVAEEKAASLEKEANVLRPKLKSATEDLQRAKAQLDEVNKKYEQAQAEIDRSRNDIRKLRSELQYSEKRRLHAEQQEEISSKERVETRAELADLRASAALVEQNNKALQEACSILEEQLTELEKLSDINEAKCKDLECELSRIRVELELKEERLLAAASEAEERKAAAARAAEACQRATEQARQAESEIEILQERLSSRERRITELEEALSRTEGERAAAASAASGGARRVKDLQEECATLRTSLADQRATIGQLQAALDDANQELEGMREAGAAASAWWRTRETKADATLRQQAKLIDFLQAKVEEKERKKGSLSNKLFGRSTRAGRRAPAAPDSPLRRANRELKEEVERLKAKLAANTNGDFSYPATPRRNRPEKETNGTVSIDTPDGPANTSVDLVWADGRRERVRVRCSAGGVCVERAGAAEEWGRLGPPRPPPSTLKPLEAIRAFSIKMDNTGEMASVVCRDAAQRAELISRLDVGASAAYRPAPLLAPHASRRQLATALWLAPDSVALGDSEGLQSLRGPVTMECEGGAALHSGVDQLACCAAHVLAVCGESVLHAPTAQLSSALRRAPELMPAVTFAPVDLPDASGPILIESISDESREGLALAVARGRRLFLLRYDAAAAKFCVARCLTADRPPHALLLTPSALFIAGDKPLRVRLPSGALEFFGKDEPTVAAAARKHSPPRALLLIRKNPIEILICYSECGVFLDENGRRSRSEDPKWSSAARDWRFVAPCLYVIGDDKITIVHVSDEAYRAPPCTCDATSLSSTSDYYVPEIYSLKLKDPKLLGTCPTGIIVSHVVDGGAAVAAVEGMVAFKSVGASIESLETISNGKGSTTDLVSQSGSALDVSVESPEPATTFSADIRNRAKQLRTKHHKSSAVPDDVIRHILTTEVGIKRNPNARRSPTSTSEFDSDSESENEKTETTKNTADLCADMFARQVRFQ